MTETTRPALPLAVVSAGTASGYAILHGLARRTAPNAAALQWEPRKPLGRHMTKGQRAMAVAKIYPEPEKGGRGKKLPANGEFSGVPSQRISEARTVLQYAPDPAGNRHKKGPSAKPGP